jgi:hypothetical protein
VTTVLHMKNRGEMWSLQMKRQSDNFTWQIMGKCEAYRWKDKVTTVLHMTNRGGNELKRLKNTFNMSNINIQHKESVPL